MSERYKLRMRLFNNGHIPLPCYRDDKHPVLIAWPDVVVMQAHIDGWDLQFTAATNTGIRSAGFDLDISDDEVCSDLENEIIERLGGRGEILLRFGRAPRRFIPICVTDNLTKQLRAFKDKAGIPHGIELLGSRSQFIAYGTHPAGYTYRWARGRGLAEIPASELPQISAQEALQVFEHLCEALVQRHGYTETTRSGSGINGHYAGGASDGSFDVDTALDTMEPTGASVEDTQRRVILSWLQRGKHPEDIEQELVDHTMRVANDAGIGWTREAEVEAVRSRIIQQFETTVRGAKAPPHWLPSEWAEKAITILGEGGKLTLGFNRSGWYPRRKQACSKNSADCGDRSDNTDDHNDSSGGDGETPPAAPNTVPDAAAGKKPKGPFIIKPFTWFDPALLPQREWLYGRHYQRRTVSCTTAPGGFGKTTLDMIEGVAMTTCRDLLGEQPLERLRVWIHNGEDNLVELNRRIAAVCQYYSIDMRELEGWLFLTSGSEFPLKVATGFNDLRIDSRLVDRIAEQIAHNKIDVAILDPLITLHGGFRG